MKNMRLIMCATFVAISMAVPTTATASASVAALTKAQAYQRARICLRNHGATFVTRRADGGGLAVFGRASTFGSKGSTFWTYKTFLGQVASVTVYFAGAPGLPRAGKRAVEKCLTAGI